MTRTARSSHPRAVIKDRSESRSGLDNSLRKSGAGQHNWGSFADEQELESQAIADEALEDRDERTVPRDELLSPSAASPPAKPPMSRSSSSMSDQDLEAARKIRKNALKKAANGDIDLSAIARSSAAVGSPPSASLLK